ncbi:MAG: tripartite tricarboxylate transporter permease [Thermodesulfobacteriota bacterium]
MIEELISHLLTGFGVALTAKNIFWCTVGVTLGTLIGVLPGLGPAATLAMLLPLTFNFPPVTALIMLAGIYYGSQYGGSTTAIMVNLPGEASSVVTCLDGYSMARQGRGGPALAMAALASFFAGCFGILLIALFGPPLAELALTFSSAEYFALMVMGLLVAAIIAQGPLIKAIGMVLLGLLLGLVGMDVNSSTLRFTFGIPELHDGIGFALLAMGLFGYSDIIANLELREKYNSVTSKIQGLIPSWSDFRDSFKPMLRGTAVGSVLGILPGAGPIISSFVSYSVEKRIAADPSRFGKGAIEGVAAPEAANNASAQTAFIPLLTLGIPVTGTMALMLGAMMIHGIAPGPEVMTKYPDLCWGLVASMWIGNLMLVLLNLPLIGVWIRLLTISYRFVYPAILLFCCIGAYSLNNRPLDVALAGGFGLLGYIFTKLDCEPAPLLLGFILGPLMETHLRRAMLLSRGDPTVFFTRPISLGILLATGLSLFLAIISAVRRKRKEKGGMLAPG